MALICHPIAPAPGAGKMLLFISGLLIARFSGGVYTNISATDAVVRFHTGDYGVVSDGLYNGTIGGETTGHFSFFFTNSVPEGIAQFGPYAANAGQTGIVAGGSYGVSDVENQPLTLEIYNGSGLLTGGHAANALRVIALYAVVTL